MDTDELELVTAAIAAAPFTAEGWTTALASMARATGGWGGQLIAQARDRFEFDSVVNLPPEAFKDYMAHGGNDPARTPRLRAALSGPPMKAICDEDYMTVADRSRWPIYSDLYEPYDAHYCASARVADHRGRSLSIVLFHSRGAGPYQRAQVDAVDRLLPHVRRAFEVWLAIEAEAASMALGAFEALAQPALLCAASGRLIGASAAGEAALRSGRFLTVRGGVVRAASPDYAAALERAIRHAAAPIGLAAPPAGGVRLVDAEGRTPPRSPGAAASAWRRSARSSNPSTPSSTCAAPSSSGRGYGIFFDPARSRHLNSLPPSTLSLRNGASGWFGSGLTSPPRPPWGGPLSGRRSARSRAH